MKAGPFPSVSHSPFSLHRLAPGGWLFLPTARRDSSQSPPLGRRRGAARRAERPSGKGRDLAGVKMDTTITTCSSSVIWMHFFPLDRRASVIAAHASATGACRAMTGVHASVAAMHAAAIEGIFSAIAACAAAIPPHAPVTPAHRARPRRCAPMMAAQVPFPTGSLTSTAGSFVIFPPAAATSGAFPAPTPPCRHDSRPLR